MSPPRRLRVAVIAAWLVTPAALALVPTLTRRDDVVNFAFITLLFITLAQSWNILGGYAGQVNLGHAAFFGAGALVTRWLWTAGVNVVLAMLGGAAIAVLFGLVLGMPAFRLRGAYFAIGTLVLAEILRITVGNLLPEISTLPTSAIGRYRLADRYYLALALAVVATLTVALLGSSRAGLGMRAVREDEGAAEASGVQALRLKLRRAPAIHRPGGTGRRALRVLPHQLLPPAPLRPELDLRRAAHHVHRRRRARSRAPSWAPYSTRSSRSISRSTGWTFTC